MVNISLGLVLHQTLCKPPTISNTYFMVIFADFLVTVIVIEVIMFCIYTCIALKGPASGDLSVHLSVCVSCLFVCLSVCLSVCLCLSVCVCLSVCLFVCLSVCLVTPSLDVTMVVLVKYILLSFLVSRIKYSYWEIQVSLKEVSFILRLNFSCVGECIHTLSVCLRRQTDRQTVSGDRQTDRQ